jgi:hypothetical protein
MGAFFNVLLGRWAAGPLGCANNTNGKNKWVYASQKQLSPVCGQTVAAASP